MPGVAVVVVVIGSVIFVASHHLATVPGVTAVIITPPQVEFIVAFQGVIVNLSLLPKSSDFSWSSGISKGGRHGDVIGELSGVGGIGGRSDNYEDVVFLGGFLYGGPSSIQYLHLGHSICGIVRFLCLDAA